MYCRFNNDKNVLNIIRFKRVFNVPEKLSEAVNRRRTVNTIVVK
jgi:hypothetical protein